MNMMTTDDADHHHHHLYYEADICNLLHTQTKMARLKTFVYAHHNKFFFKKICHTMMIKKTKL